MVEQKVSAIWKINKSLVAKFSSIMPPGLYTDLPFKFQEGDDSEYLRGLKWSVGLYGEEDIGEEGIVRFEIEATSRVRADDSYDRGRSIWANLTALLLDEHAKVLTTSESRIVEYSPYLDVLEHSTGVDFKPEDLDGAIHRDGSLHVRIDVTILNVRESLRCREVLRGMLTNETQTDFNVTVGEQTFNLHKAVLAETSTVFAAMFDSGLREAVNGVLALSDTTPEAFRAFTETIYGTRGDFLSDIDLTQGVLHLADKYNVGSLKQYCDAGLAAKVNDENALEVLTHGAVLCNAETTKAKCIAILAERTEFKESQVWLDFKKHNRGVALEILDSVNDKLIASVKHLKREASDLRASIAPLARERDAAKAELNRKCEGETAKASSSKRHRK